MIEQRQSLNGARWGFKAYTVRPDPLSLADAVGIHVNQIKRYEAGTTQPTLEALIRLAKSLHISLDTLVFGEADDGPVTDERLRFQLEAIGELEEEDKRVIQEVLEGLILRYQAKRWTRISNA